MSETTTNRRLNIAGSLILSLGLFVGVAAGVGLALGFEPARLPAVLLNIAAYKLAFVAAGGLLTAGAVVVRYARREALRDAHTQTEGPRRLGEPLYADRVTDIAVRERAPSEVGPSNVDADREA